MWELMFFVESILLGFGLAMDAFSVSLANGLNEPEIKKRKIFEISGIFALLQALMPMIGYICVHTFVQYFSAFEKFVPWIACFLLCIIGGNMILESFKKDEDNKKVQTLGLMGIIVQGIATSIDALSVGFTISEYQVIEAIVSVLIIGVLTFGICFSGVLIGKKFGTKLSNKATIFGGIILIIIGIEILLTNVL